MHIIKKWTRGGTLITVAPLSSDLISMQGFQNLEDSCPFSWFPTLLLRNSIVWISCLSSLIIFYYDFICILGNFLPPWSPSVWSFTMMCSCGCSFYSQHLALAGCFHSENVCPSGKSSWIISLMFLFPSFLLFILSGTPICQLIGSNGLILLNCLSFPIYPINL